MALIPTTPPYMGTGVCNYVITIHIGNTGNIYNIVLLEITLQLIICVVLLSDQTNLLTRFTL